MEFPPIIFQTRNLRLQNMHVLQVNIRPLRHCNSLILRRCTHILLRTITIFHHRRHILLKHLLQPRMSRPITSIRYPIPTIPTLTIRRVTLRLPNPTTLPLRTSHRCQTLLTSPTEMEAETESRLMPLLSAQSARLSSPSPWKRRRKHPRIMSRLFSIAAISPWRRFVQSCPDTKSCEFFYILILCTAQALPIMLS